MNHHKTGLAFVALACFSYPAQAQKEWLALCNQCVNPSVVAKSGLDTANATAEARITRDDIKAWCDNWQPDDKTCVKQQLAAEDTTKVYRARADCPAGRITPIDGNSYSLAGLWDNSDIGGGRTRWRDAAGKIVGRDNASGGLGIAQQWELLCPSFASGKPKAGAKSKATGQPAAAGGASSASGFTVGQQVLAKYGREWVPARIDAIRTSNGPNGPTHDFDVTLIEQQKRGIVPARMLRAR